MKPTPRLIREVRALFAVLRWGPLFAIIVASGTLIFPFQPVKGTVDFTPGTVAVHSTGSDAGTATLQSLSGSISLPSDPDKTPELVRIVRWAWVPAFLVQAVAWAVILNLIYQLCRAVEAGEIFSDRTLRLVQWLGLTLIIESLVNCAAETWARVALNRYLLAHYHFAGLSIADPTNPLNLHGTSSNWVTGLLVLVLAEVFRQGLMLKREAELTV